MAKKTEAAPSVQIHRRLVSPPESPSEALSSRQATQRTLAWLSAWYRFLWYRRQLARIEARIRFFCPPPVVIYPKDH